MPVSHLPASSSQPVPCLSKLMCLESQVLGSWWKSHFQVLVFWVGVYESWPEVADVISVWLGQMAKFLLQVVSSIPTTTLRLVLALVLPCVGSVFYPFRPPSFCTPQTLLCCSTIIFSLNLHLCAEKCCLPPTLTPQFWKPGSKWWCHLRCISLHFICQKELVLTEINKILFSKPIIWTRGLWSYLRCIHGPNSGITAHREQELV